MNQAPKTGPVEGQIHEALASCREGWRALRVKGPEKVWLWVVALIVGIAAGFAALLFRKGIYALQAVLYGAEDVRAIHSFAAGLDWYWLIAIPALGGLAVGVILNTFTPDGRAQSVAEVIEAAALNEGRLGAKPGLASAAASLITLSSGGSTGREGPVVHLAGVIASWVSVRIGAQGMTARDLLGCAVAAAVSASFNAPIAGALFALEVVLRHFAVHAFAPIVIASVAGTVINRLEFGDITEFALAGEEELAFYVELPAFLILGLVCGLVAALMTRSVFLADDLGTAISRKMRLPAVLRPALAGALLGAIAIAFPHIIGVGYETTTRALHGNILFFEALAFAVIKVGAVAITMAGRMGGGIFSPSLMVGALTGLTFGIVATGLLPQVSGTTTLYALAGMGALAAAVLGAPISTTLIVFELTGDWQTGLAVMVAVSTSTALASRLVHRSFFLSQIERKGIRLAAGPQAYLLATIRVANVMRGHDDANCADGEAIREAIEDGYMIDGNATLEAGLPVLETSGRDFLAVIRAGGEGEAPEILGALYHVDALRAYNRALAAMAAEEHS